MEDKVCEYKIPIRLGIDDIDYYPGLEAEWWTDKDWKEYYDDLPARKERDRLYVEQLRMEGRYGMLTNYSIKFQHNPMFDNNVKSLSSLLGGYKMVFLNDKD